MENEKKLATQLLKIKESGYPSPWIALFGKKKIHFIRYLAVGFLVYILVTAWNDIFMRSIFLCFLGFLLGGITKEIVFMNKIKDSWPFTVKVTNWNIVANLAGAPVEPDDGINSVTSLRDSTP